MTSEDAKKTTKDIAERVTDRAESFASSAKAAAEGTRDNVREFAGRAASAASDLVDDTSAHARDAFDRLPDASEAVATGRRAYEQGSRTVRRQVARQPLEALLLAGAIGYLVGWATNRS